MNFSRLQNHACKLGSGQVRLFTSCLLSGSLLWSSAALGQTSAETAERAQPFVPQTFYERAPVVVQKPVETTKAAQPFVPQTFYDSPASSSVTKPARDVRFQYASNRQPGTEDSGNIPSLPDEDVIVEREAPQQQFTPTDDTPTILDGTIFTSPPATGYSADSSTAGSIINVPTLELPSSVDVITQDLRQDQQAISVDDVLRDISSAVKVGNTERPDSFFLRGFEVRATDWRKNNFNDPTFTPRDFANVQRIEVLKGPASALYGPGQPSGTVNVITKKPLDYSYNAADYQFGSYNLHRVTADSTGRIDPDGNSLYRLNVAWQDAEGFRDFDYNDRLFIAPVVTFVLDPDTTLTWEGEYHNDSRQFDTGVPAFGTNVRAVPIRNFMGEPANDFKYFQDIRQSIFLNRKYSDDSALSLGYSSLFYSAPSSGTIPDDRLLGPIFSRSRQDFEKFEEQYHTVIGNFASKQCWWGYEHEFLVGGEVGFFLSDPSTVRNSGIIKPTINALNPTYTDPFAPTPVVFNSTFYQGRYGAFMQDLMKIDEQWSVLFGVRYDISDYSFFRESSFSFIPLIPPTTTEQAFHNIAPRIGVVYEDIPDVLSYYATFSSSFAPPAGGARSTDVDLQPELGSVFELGTKCQLLEDFMVTFAWFGIDKRNVLIDEFSGGSFTTRQIGQQTSTGVEFGFQGQITDEWSMAANWAYTDTRINDPGDPEIDGQRARGVPLSSANIWTRYNLIDNCEHTFGLAVGLVHADKRSANSESTVLLPGYTRWDAGAFYEQGPMVAQVYLENIGDIGYYTGSVNEFQIYPGAPFNVRGQVGVRY